MICILCGNNNTVIAAPFVENPNKWTIHRANYVEVTFEMKQGVIMWSSDKLTIVEVNYIVEHIIKQNA